MKTPYFDSHIIVMGFDAKTNKKIKDKIREQVAAEIAPAAPKKPTQKKEQTRHED